MPVSLGKGRGEGGRGEERERGGKGRKGEGRKGRGRKGRGEERERGKRKLRKCSTIQEHTQGNRQLFLFPHFPLPPSLPLSLLTSCASSSPGKVTYQQSFSANSQLINLGHVSFENSCCISCTCPHIVNTTDNDQQATPTSLGVSFAISLNMRTHLFSGTARTLVRVGSI